ncbi:MAG: signal peptide peptidase SppA [Thermoleophilia bacterium]|nr:signal peptide peptidase SppA [Thermoleophilia bacterium]
MTEQTPPQVPPPTPPPPPPPVYPPAWAKPPRPARPAWQWGCGLVLAGCLVAITVGILLIVVGVVGSMSVFQGVDTGGEGVALIRIEGMILSGQSGFSPFAGVSAGSDDIVKQIEKASEDKEARAILLRVNSPGGSAAASQEIYNAVTRAKKAGKPVIVSMADVAASGGYYVSCPADVIFADPATVTGSIGVIALHEDLSGLLKKIGVETETIKSGKLKDMGSPTGPLSDEARQVYRAYINQVFAQFVNAVAEGRGMKKEAVLALADGRIYTGEEAKKNGLVDEIGGLQEAVAEAGKRGGIKGKPELKRYGAPGLLHQLLGAQAAQRTQPIAVTGGLLYDDMAARLVQGALKPSSVTAQTRLEGQRASDRRQLRSPSAAGWS